MKQVHYVTGGCDGTSHVAFKANHRAAFLNVTKRLAQSYIACTLQGQWQGSIFDRIDAIGAELRDLAKNPDVTVSTCFF